jgi:hypothetical protein
MSEVEEINSLLSQIEVLKKENVGLAKQVGGSKGGVGMNIMIPLGGIGSRFAKEGYLRPKPFVKGRECARIDRFAQQLMFFANSTFRLELLRTSSSARQVHAPVDHR